MHNIYIATRFDFEILRYRMASEIFRLNAFRLLLLWVYQLGLTRLTQLDININRAISKIQSDLLRKLIQFELHGLINVNDAVE